MGCFEQGVNILFETNSGVISLYVWLLDIHRTFCVISLDVLLHINWAFGAILRDICLFIFWAFGVTNLDNSVHFFWRLVTWTLTFDYIFSGRLVSLALTFGFIPRRLVLSFSTFDYIFRNIWYHERRCLVTVSFGVMNLGVLVIYSLDVIHNVTGRAKCVRLT